MSMSAATSLTKTAGPLVCFACDTISPEISSFGSDAGEFMLGNLFSRFHCKYWSAVGLVAIKLNMSTKPTADQYLQWKRENKFPSINSPASEPKLEISGLIVSQAKQTNGPAVLVSDVAADIDMRVHKIGRASCR